MKRLAAFGAAIALLAGGLIGGVAAPASADATVFTYGDLVTEMALGGTVTLGGPIVAIGGTTVPSGITTTLDLAGQELTLFPSATPGIEVPVGATLTIEDSLGGGSFTALSTGGHAGIGGAAGQGAGTITIAGGTIDPTGGDGGAGIGGGQFGDGGTVTISGGRVDALGNSGAGIGGGEDGAGGTVIITGGTIEASGYTGGGAGIGGGAGGTGNGAAVTISGGDVTATGGTGAAGIGGGSGGGGGTLTMTGGVVTSEGTEGGAGIGGGFAGAGPTISISGGELTASTTGGTNPDDATSIGSGVFYLFPVPPVSIAGTASTGSATAAAGGLTSQPSAFTGDGTAGVTYIATSANGNPISKISFEYAVTFDVDGGLPDPLDQAVAWGFSATEPTAPTKAGFVFDGWHVGSAAGPMWDFADPVTEPLDLVASWVELPSISGTPPDGAVGAAYNYAMTVSPVTATVTVLTGSLPPGLSVDSAGVISGIPTTIGPFTATLRASNAAGHDDVVVQIDIVAGADQVVSFDPDGGTPDPPDQMIGLGEKVIEPGDPAKAGFAFIEWRVGSNGGPAYDFNQVVTGPLSLVAAWGEQPTLTGPAMASGTAGDPIATVQLVVGGPSVTVTDDGTLPSGLTFNAGTLQVTGIPNGLAGTYPVTFTAHNTFGDTPHVVTFTIAHGLATSFTTTASDFTPNQGDTITVTTTASDGFGNSWDASADDTITSDVPTDVIVGNQVTFPHASPHVLTVVMPNLPAQQLVLQVAARAALGLTGSAGALQALPIAILTILCGTALIVLRRRSEA